MRMTATLFLGAAMILTTGTALAHDGTSHAQDEVKRAVRAIVGARRPVDEDKARTYFTDRRVVTQTGEELRFYSDVLKDRVVLVTLFYTECTGMCPITNQKLAEVQDLLGDRMGQDIWFVSVSLDPETDTPEVLRDYAENFEAGPGWLFLTGNPEDLKVITYRLGQTSDRIESHNPFLMLGNVKYAHWKRLRPNEPAEAIAQRLKFMLQPTAFRPPTD